METMKKWLRNTITNAWIGKATKAGLVEAMDELYYTWGSEGMGASNHGVWLKDRP